MEEDISLTTHDFTSELRPLLILGGFEITKKSRIGYILNIFFLLFMLFLYIFLGSMALITIIYLSLESEIKVQAFYVLSFILVAVYMPGSKLACTGSLSEAAALIRRGIFVYSCSRPDQRENEIKKSRIVQIRSVTSKCLKLCYVSAFSNIFLTVLGAVLSDAEADDETPLNPYLPLPIYFPFDTRSSLGYSVAFASDCMYMTVLYTSCICFMQTFLSCELQFVAHLEVLTYSILNIENRAIDKYREINPHFQREVANLYESKEFLKCLRFCLRENIIHHQTILRYKSAIKPYIEAMNALAISFFSIVMAASVVVFIELMENLLSLRSPCVTDFFVLYLIYLTFLFFGIAYRAFLKPDMHPGIKLALIISCISQVVYFFLMCYLGQLISDKSENILNALYSTPWPQCDEQFRVLLRIFIINVKKPITMNSTLINIPASLGTFADMALTGYKIINILRTNM